MFQPSPLPSTEAPILHRIQKYGFTLIELLVVIAIIGLLAAILFPVFSRVRAKAKQSQCISNERQIGLAVTQYVQDFDETYPFAYTYPVGISWQTALSPYLTNTQVLVCPANRRPTSYTLNSKSTYTVNHVTSNLNGIFGYQDQWGVMSPAKSSEVQLPATTIAVLETNWNNANFSPATPYYSAASGPAGPTVNISLYAGHFGMTNYLFADGHVKSLQPQATLTAGEGGSGAVNAWRLDGKAFTDATFYPDLTSAKAVIRLSTDYYNP